MKIFMRILAVIISPILLAACWDLGLFELDETDFDRPFSGTYFSIVDETGPVGVYRRDGNWFVPQHPVDPSEKSIPQKKFEASRFAIVFIDKFAPDLSFNGTGSSRSYSELYSSDQSKRLAILVGQESSISGPGGQYIVPVLIDGALISRCTGEVFSTEASHFGEFLQILNEEGVSSTEKTREIFQVAIQNMLYSTTKIRMNPNMRSLMNCEQEVYQVTEIPRTEVRAAVAQIVPAKAARLADKSAKEAEAKRTRLARLEAEGVQTRLHELNGYYHVSKMGVARFDHTGYRGGARAYNLNVLRGHPNATARNGRMGRLRFFADTQQFEYQAYAATRNGSCAEYTDRIWSARYEFSEREAPGVWYEGRQYSHNRQDNPNACVAYDVTVGSCRRVRCSLRARNQPYLGSVYIAQDYNKALALYDRLRSN